MKTKREHRPSFWKRDDRERRMERSTAMDSLSEQARGGLEDRDRHTTKWDPGALQRSSMSASGCCCRARRARSTVIFDEQTFCCFRGSGPLWRPMFRGHLTINVAIV